MIYNPHTARSHVKRLADTWRTCEELCGLDVSCGTFFVICIVFGNDECLMCVEDVHFGFCMLVCITIARY